MTKHHEIAIKYYIFIFINTLIKYIVGEYFEYLLLFIDNL